jgi:SAM-dependent methyltransferase
VSRGEDQRSTSRFRQALFSRTLELKTAIGLIEKGISNASPQQWLDLGCGDGLFSQALLTALNHGSSVIAIDKSESALDKVPAKEYPGLKTLGLDFVHDTIPYQNVDGLLMANALHFVKNKATLFDKISGNLKPLGRIIIVEYGITIPNPWVPYPINFNKLSSLCQRVKWPKPTLMTTTPSAFSGREIYSAGIFF